MASDKGELRARVVKLRAVMSSAAIFMACPIRRTSIKLTVKKTARGASNCRNRPGFASTLRLSEANMAMTARQRKESCTSSPQAFSQSVTLAIMSERRLPIFSSRESAKGISKTSTMLSTMEPDSVLMLLPKKRSR